MLFDLQGKRRRVVQATYLMLAVLMGGGLVLFGIGGDVSGGLFDAFSDSRSGGSSDEALDNRIERNEKRLAQGGAAREAALQELVRDYYAKATSSTDPNTGEFPEDAQDDLQKAATAWERYVAVVLEKPDADTAEFALRVYDPLALNKPEKAQEVASLIAEADNTAAAYLRLVQYATLAGDTRTADLAGQKAIDLAPKADKKAVKQQVALAKQPATQPPAGAPAPSGE